MLNLRNFYIPSFLLIAPFVSNGASQMNPSFSGSDLKVIDVQPDKNTGLDKIFVIYDTAGVKMSFRANDPSTAKVYKYSNLGGGYAEEIVDIIRTSEDVSLSNFDGNLGYIFEDGTDRYYFWIVEYKDYRFSINSVVPAAIQDCDATVLEVDGSAQPIHYFTINGQQRELSRDISILFDTQEYKSDSHSFQNVSKTVTISSFDHTVRISPASLAYTSFHISGDRFLKQWNMLTEVESVVIPPSAVAVITYAEQADNATAVRSTFKRNRSDDLSDYDEETTDTTDSDASNIIKGDETGLGGSAPADISFSAYVSDGVMHYEWQMSSNSGFEEIDFRFNVQQLDYTFLDEGTYYLRFIGSNSDGSCEAIGDIYTVAIGASELLCPNAFSPDGDGVNDIWKISYRSLIDFDCWIFDRYGAEIYHYSDPQGGWDGKRGGKVVKPGVYYYVITATGSDGKKYKKSGDINILKKNNVSSSVDNGSYE